MLKHATYTFRYTNFAVGSSCLISVVVSFSLFLNGEYLMPFGNALDVDAEALNSGSSLALSEITEFKCHCVYTPGNQVVSLKSTYVYAWQSEIIHEVFIVCQG